MLVSALYDEVWRQVRVLLRGHRPLSEEFLWHQVYRLYVEKLPKPVAALEAAIGRCHCEVCRNTLVECHLRIVGPIAGQIAWKRFPAKPFGDGHDDLVHELIATGNLGLFEAVDHFKAEAGRFSTIANFWIRKFIGEGDRAHDIFGREGLVTPCYLPKRHLAPFAVGLTGTKSTSRKDASPDDDSDEFDLLDSEGRTSRKYLQRHIGEGGARFLWRDEGTYAVPRIKLPGHPGGAASRESVSETERDFEKRNRDWQDNCFLEHAGQTAKRVLTPVEYRVFAARFLNKKKSTHQQLGDKLGFTESGIRRIKDRAFRKVWDAPPLPIAQTVEAMAKFYSVTPRSDLDEFVDVAKKKFPNATAKQRHAAWKAAGLFDTLDVCPRENRGEGSFNSWDFVKDNFKHDDKLARREKALAEYRANHPLPTWTNWEPFAVSWLRRSAEPTPWRVHIVGFPRAAMKKPKPWIKPTITENVWYALAA